MKLRRLFAAVLALALFLNVSPVPATYAVTQQTPAMISAVDTDYVLRSAAIKYVEGNAFVERGDVDGVNADDPMIDTLLTQAPGEFNKSGEEWLWIAYKISVPADGTYSLGVTVNNARDAKFKMPMVINHEVHTLSFTAKKQTVTTEVALPAGEHIVTVFWPMPATASEALDADYKNYIWANVQTLVVDDQLTVCAAPTAEEVETYMVPNTTVAATDAQTILWSAAMGDKGSGYLEFNSRDAVKADRPYIDSLHDDAPGQFNKTGEEWGWFAYQVSAPADGSYTLQLQMQNCRNAPYDMPLYVNEQIYTLSYAATGRQTASVDVTLSAGEHTVVIFMPMPKNADQTTGEDWVDYPWANPERITVDGLLSVSMPTVEEVEACFANDGVIPAKDADRILHSATIQVADTYLGRTDQATIGADAPSLDAFFAIAPDEFNKTGEEWNWFAFQVTAAVEGTYTLGVKTSGSKYASYQIPVCVDGKVYALQYMEKAQTVTTEVNLKAGTHTVVVFMPMPAAKDKITNNVWNDYHWCNIESVSVDTALTVSKPTVAQVEESISVLTISSVDTEKILHSATIKVNANTLGRTDQATMKEDQPTVETLLADLQGQFNQAGQEWNWFAFQVTAAVEGTYTLGVKTSGSKYASYQIPVCVDGKVYALQYTEKAQTVTTEVNLKAGTHTVIVLMPMPATKEAITNNEWNDYHWCDMESVRVDAALTVSKPTVAQVEESVSVLTISTVDTEKILHSATIKVNANTLGRTDQETMKEDLPTVETLLADLQGQFNQAGQEWNWFAFQVTAAAEGTYTLGVKTSGSKYASYQIPVCVDGKVYALQYTEAAQTVTTEVNLKAGTHTVIVLMPMPATKEAITNNAWNDYHWCDMESIRVDAALTVSKPTVAQVEESVSVLTISTVDTEKILHSATIKQNAGGVSRTDQATMKEDQPSMETLLVDLRGQFNQATQEWNWFAFQVTAATEGTYTLGVKTSGSKYASYQIPVCVDGKVYALQYTEKAQTITTEVTLKAGTHTVVVFMPMPATKDKITNNEWNDYHWCDMESVSVDAALTVSKPTVAQVEESVSVLTISTVDTEKILHSATIKVNANTLGRTDQATMKEDQPTVETLFTDMQGQFNQAGQEWNWFAFQVTAAVESTYTLGVKTSGSKYASYQIPVCVDGKVYALQYTEAAQTVTTEVPLEVGTHMVIVFMPMPATKDKITNNEWNDYHWCDMESIRVDAALTVSKPTVAAVEGSFGSTTISAVDTDRILHSDTIKINANTLGRTDQATMGKVQPTIEELYWKAYGQFNAPGQQWNWFAFQVTAATEGTYTLKVKTSGSKYDSYQLPVCVGGKVYALQYTQKAQTVATEIPLNAGNHVVVVFMPMPATKADVTNNSWNDYHWCDVESITVDSALAVSKPTVAQVEACFPDLVPDTPLKEKSVLFVGDGITGAKESWASIIGTQNRMDWTNSGVRDAAISDQTDKLIMHQLMLHAGKTFDYVIMHGGIHDAQAEVGAVSESWNVTDFDTATYAGALEAMFYYAYENFAGAKLGFVINYATPNADQSKWKGTQDMSAYVAQAKKVCDKWGISYIDLYCGTTADGKSYSGDILQVDQNAASFLDGDPAQIYLSAEGYKLISPYIAQWMETLSDKTSPVPADCSGKYIDAADAGKVLFRGFTPKKEYKGGLAVSGLQDRVYTGMAEDLANIQLLPYARELLGDWAFASIAVEAAQDGEYTIAIQAAAKTASQMGMLVDGQVYTLSYDKGNGYYQLLKQTVSLTKGTHYITFTAAMPADDNHLEGNAWDLYPWTNLASIAVDRGLQVLGAPSLEAVTDKLQAYTPLYTRVEAEDGQYVLYNNYNTPNEENAAASGGMVVGGAWNSTYRQTFEELEKWMNFKANAYVEYAVVAPADGEYDIRVGFLAGSTDKTIEKPYIAVIVNDTTYKTQFTKNWNQIDKAKLTVSLKKGLNIIRCTGITTDQQIYGVKGWVNHDFLDVDTRLTPVKRTAPVVVEAESSKFINKLKVQDAAETEEASGKVLGSSERRYVNALQLSLDQLNQSNLRQVPYFSLTVSAPQDGYYPIRVGMASDGRLKNSTIGVLVDGTLQPVEYNRTDKTVRGAQVQTLVYLTAGDHVITFTTPMPATKDPQAVYSYYWSNFDTVTLYDGLSLAQQQKAPTGEPEYMRLEVEEYAMLNLNKNTGTAAGGAYYKTLQSLAQIKETGIDGGKTAYVEFTVHAAKTGSYMLYLGVNAGMTAGSTRDQVEAALALEVNGTVTTQYVHAAKTTNYTILPVSVKLEAGENTLRLTHLTSDSQFMGTTWIDFDYVELPYSAAQNLVFEKPGETLEAESARYSGFGENLSDAYSGGRYLGRANYDTVAEVNVTFDNMDPQNLSGVPFVTYRVFAEKAGTYAVSVGFAAGLTNYSQEEIQQGVDASFVVIVNGKSKQRVPFSLRSSSANMSRMVLLELAEGENEVTVTGTTTEYVIDRIPRNEETYRMVWIDQDYLKLSGQLSSLGQDVDPFDIEDSGYDFAQLVPRERGETLPQQQENHPSYVLPVILWTSGGVLCAGILLIIVWMSKKKKRT